MIAPPNTSNLGISELTAQLAALAQQSGLALTPAAAAATASFMALTSQNSGPGAQSMSASPNLSAILAALQVLITLLEFSTSSKSKKSSKDAGTQRNYVTSYSTNTKDSHSKHSKHRKNEGAMTSADRYLMSSSIIASVFLYRQLMIFT
uniref:Uncharacterized protein n=1 Tax=Trichobilharzia regenti TaxID=157069 RepID=A0AA85IUY9_TRIRE|nr:unnamed protein product [Trichobilharzia regenti]